MKNNSLIRRSLALFLVGACIASSVSCMTTYDAYGRPVQSVDPALAVAGIAAAGLIGAAAANSHSHHGHYGGGYGYHGGGYYRSYRHCY